MTQGLSDARLAPFADHPDLVLAIEEAVANHRALRGRWSDALAGSEAELSCRLQAGYVNFYTPETVNPYVALAARGPWIVTSHGAVIHDSGGYGMLGLGHAPQKVVDAMSRPWVMANIMTPSFSQARFVEALRDSIGETRGGCPFAAFQCLNSGSESVTLACRISDMHAKRMTDAGGKHAGKRPVFMALEGAFHGRTDRPAHLSDSSRDTYHRLLASHHDEGGLVTVPPNDVAALEAAFRRVAEEGHFVELLALEPVQGEGNPGIACTREFYDAARRLTLEHDALLLIDSIQAGFRTTGHLSIVDYPGFEDCQEPDLETYSKALNAGQYPLSVLGLSARAAAAFRAGTYGNTMTTNPRALEVGIAVLEAIDESMQKNVRAQGEHILRRLEELRERYPALIVRNQGTGLLCASVIRDDVRVVGNDGLEQQCRRLGLGVIHGGENALRFTPHFGITDAEVDLMVDVLDEVFAANA
ncbi:MAG: aminotransferase class III-fold pyridoxal phosphate-dependent enzyme [Planctomycetota bacterium]